jgi:two-component system phosphate regulon sensor histidine kinase PhoR
LSFVSWFLFALFAAAFAFWFYRLAVDPALRLLEALRQMGRGDWEAAHLIEHPGWLRGATMDLRTLGERLRTMDRRRTDESLDFRAILGSLSEGVLIVDAAQRIRLANDSVQRMFGLPAAPLGRTLLEVFRNHELHETVSSALREGRPQNREVTLDSRQGNRHTQKHFSITAASLDGSSGGGSGARPPAGAIAIFHDITELKALSTARRDFVANVSHELRTPLSIINGYLETLLDGALDDRPTAQRFLQIMWKHNERLHLLIEDLLSLSQLESRQAGGLTFERISLRACLERVLERLEPLIKEKGAVIRLELPDREPPLEADAHRLDQAFFNLLENALKYGNAEQPEIRVAAEFDGSEARIAITDNGTGIPQADQPHIFERFYRVHKNRARAVGGTGLGLAIVKHIVQAHGGQVSVESQPGHGATFRFRLPIEQGKLE